MEIDSTQALVLAFQNLDTFSIPRVGTFNRKGIPAVVDHKQGTIEPPSSTVELGEGESHTKSILGFFSKRYNLSDGKARELLDNVSKSIFLQLEVNDKFDIPGVGRIKKEGKGQVFDPVELKHDDKFGLSSVGYSLGKKKVAKKSVDKVVPVVKEVPTPKVVTPVVPAVAATGKTSMKSEPVKKATVVPPVQKKTLVKKKKRSPVLPIALVILLLLLVGGSFFFRTEIKNFLAAKGIFFAAATVDSSSEKIPDTSLKIPAVTDTVADVEDDTNSKENNSSNGNWDSGSTYSSYSGSGQQAKSGQFYLIVASYKNGGKAESDLPDYGPGAKIILPPGGGRYRVSVFNASNKDDVIREMVKTKSQYTKGSWIYYIGL